MSYNQPFTEQLAFFRQKLNLPTERWDDIKLAAHDRAFVVAGAQSADLLADLNTAIDKAIAKGTGLDAFRKDFDALVAKNGWTGWTGEGTPGGVAWRTKVIYQTNMATSYAAGRFKQLSDPDLLKILPYWRYHHNDSVTHPRPLHVSWDGLTLPPDHPFWQTHFPPNGWGCMCWVSAVSKSAYMKAIANGKGPANTPTGTEGIDEGFGYKLGANVDTELKDFIDQKLIKLDAPIGAALWASIKPVLMAEQSTAVRDMVVVAAASMAPAGSSVIASVITPATVSALASRGVLLGDAAIWLRDHELIHAIRDSKKSVLPLDVWLNLSEYLNSATPYLDTENNTLLYAFGLPGVMGKIVVRVNYTNKVRVGGVRQVITSKVRVGGVRQVITSNFIVTGGVIEDVVLTDSRYILLGEVP